MSKKPEAPEMEPTNEPEFATVPDVPLEPVALTQTQLNALNPDWLPPATEGVEFTRDQWHDLPRWTCARCGWEKVDDAEQFDRHLRDYHRLTLPEGA